MSQTSYSQDNAVAFAGLVADNAPKYSITRASESATSVEFGRPAVAGTDAETQFALPSTTGEFVLGVTVHHHAQQDLSSSGDGIVQDEDAELLRSGTVWVVVEETVVAGDDVFFRHTTSGPLVPGGWRNDADTATADQLPNAVYLTGASADGLAKIQFNLP